MPPTLLLTRPRRSAENFGTLAAWPGRVVISPVLQVVLHSVAPPAMGEGVIVTSQHGVAALAQASERRDWAMWVVGPGTRVAAWEAGFNNLREGGGTAERLFRDLCDTPPACPLVHYRGAHATGDLAARLAQHGIRARAVTCYDQQALPLTSEAKACLRDPGDVVLPVFSPRSAALLAQAWHGLQDPAARLHALAISEAAAGGLADLPLASLHVAPSPDLAGMLAGLKGVQAALEPDQNPR